MVNEVKTHLIADESIGVQREYIEVERKANVGDYVHITKFEDEYVSEYRKVTKLCSGSCLGDFYIDEPIGYEVYFDNDNEKYTTLESTDIVHIDGAKYRLVERKAEVSEKVLVIADWYDQKVGSILEIIDGKDFGFSDEKDSVNTYYADISNKNGYIAFIEENNYRVLIPVAPSLECTPENRHEEVFVEETQCSPQVLDMLANLARRVTELERENKRITEDLGWHEMGPGRIANLRISVSELKHVVGKHEEDAEQERHDSDDWAGDVNRKLDGFESQLRDTQGNVERQAQEHATLEQVVKSVKERGITTAEQTESNTQDIADLDERTQTLVEPKQAAEALLRKIAKLIEEEGVGI